MPVTGPPQLSGPPEQTRRLLQALAAAWQEPVSGPDNHLVQALHYQQGEVSLELRLAPECGGGHIAQTAFDTLRGLLPDTDIYVRHMV